MTLNCFLLFDCCYRFIVGYEHRYRCCIPTVLWPPEMQLSLDFLAYVSDLYDIPLKTPNRIEIILEHAKRAYNVNETDKPKLDVPFFQDCDGKFSLCAETIVEFEHHAKIYNIRNDKFPNPTKILLPKENFCCGKLIRLQTRFSMVHLYCETGVVYARCYHGVCKVCKKSYYSGYCSDEKSRDYSEYLENDEYLLISSSTGFSRDFLRNLENTIFIGVVSFEAAAEIYNEKTQFSTQLNPERLEEAFFLYKILPFVTKFETWPRDTHGRVCIETIAESVYEEIRKKIDDKWMCHICDEDGCRNRYGCQCLL